MKLNNIKENILKKIDKGEEISPFLFISQNLELLNNEVFLLANEILNEKWISKYNIFRLEDDLESIKIEAVKNFFSKLNTKNPYWLQIFIIENISRLTLQASNSILKLLEEPWKNNLIFLTNNSESWVLETILSRVLIYKINFWNLNLESSFFSDLLEKFLSWDKTPLISYFYKNKLEKKEYIDFLLTIVNFIKNFKLNLEEKYLEELLNDIEAIQNNNVLARYIVDKWIITLINYE